MPDPVGDPLEDALGVASSAAGFMSFTFDDANRNQSLAEFVELYARRAPKARALPQKRQSARLGVDRASYCIEISEPETRQP